MVIKIFGIGVGFEFKMPYGVASKQKKEMLKVVKKKK
jgi:hypothetical protein